MEDSKFDLVLSELKNICNKIEEKFAQVDENFEKIYKRFEQIDARFEQIDKRFEQIDISFNKLEHRLDNLENRLDNLEKRFDNLENRFDKFEEKNETEHKTMFNILNSLTSAFLRFEADQTAKINYLLEADKERKEHQIIYAHQFTHLNDLVSQNSFRISSLEKHFTNT